MVRNDNGPDPLLAKLREEFRILPAGTRIPAIREISGQLSVSQFSVHRAFEALREEGFIQSFVGRGSFAVGYGRSDERSVVGRQARILIVANSTPSVRGTEVAGLLQRQLQETGHNVSSVNYSDATDLKDLLGRGGFDICILQPRRSVLPVECLSLLRAKASHMIVEGRYLELTDVDVFVRNRAKSIAVALSHLRERGHRSIGLLTEQLDAAAGYAEIENLYKQLYEFWGEGASTFVVRVGINQENCSIVEAIGEALKRELQDRDAYPTAMVVSGRFAAREIREGFQLADLAIPADIGIVHLRSAQMVGPDGPEFTTVGRSPERVARGIADLVQWRLENRAHPPGLVLDDSTLNPGNSSPHLISTRSNAGRLK